jgi:hypothetical protein
MTIRRLLLIVFGCGILATSAAGQSRKTLCKLEGGGSGDIQALCSELELSVNLDTLTWMLKRCVGGVANAAELLNKTIDIEDLTPEDIVLYEAELEVGTISTLRLTIDWTGMSQRRQNATGSVLAERKYRCSSEAAPP